MIKRKRYLERIRPFMNTDMIKVFTGIRRSGKSVMLSLIQDELLKSGVSGKQICAFNFESLSNAKFCNAVSLYNEIQRRIEGVEGRVYLFFDEIQEVDEWEKCVNSCRVDFDCDIYITGSNAKLLSGELATYLAGRYIEIVIYPFSFEEFLEAGKSAAEQKSVREEFLTYLQMGGMPFLSQIRLEYGTAAQYLRDIYNSVILKDVVKRNNIRDVDLLERIITYVMANIGHPFSANSISKYFRSENRKVAPETILNYIRACSDAYLFYKVSREEITGKRILSINEKYYIADHGIREAVYGGNERDIDQILENIVYMELIRRGYDVTVGKEGEKEIDFVARKGRDIIYLQVSYLLSTEETRDREFGAYDRIRDSFPKYVISMDEIDMGRNGIRHLNICDFLLNEI